MKTKNILSIAIAILLISVFRPILYTPFTYEASNINITVVYHNETYHLELLPYSSLSALKDHIELHDDVDYAKLNLNQKVKDGDIITIPLLSDTPCVSINTGTHEELMTLPGVGEAIANRIIDHRNEYGSFQTLESIMEVKGIKNRLFERMELMICL
ncbi:hypothetical protein AOC36_05995 [Erysipelothrix larvae]|uniref:Helix-hairpin-helix DNA-binding motif class 1 domain-containing protein n=1 Tax=Erysipelothrix larvae TaxID=1514105 RepID=A0A0X8GZZ3_9FIRM|nr:helix-hairpin-helix domain-containing protein [Erysipelothrix larvae]AMC93549.1 hypothetical protein AOC36_05995 [Erysipelothrix larvae]